MKPKLLVLDIETKPLESYHWRLRDENIALNQIVKDWSILGYAAKWVGKDKMIYADNRDQKNVENDKKLVKSLHKLMDQADVIIGHNSKRFDTRKINARILHYGMQPPSSYKHIDTLLLARKYFNLTSYKLEYMSEKFNSKFKKLKHKSFPGFELWSACMKGNKQAWAEMKRYAIRDVQATEELYKTLAPWGVGINFSLFGDGEHICSCGSRKIQRNGYNYTPTGKYQRYKCGNCGSEYRDAHNEVKIGIRSTKR